MVEDFQESSWVEGEARWAETKEFVTGQAARFSQSLPPALGHNMYCQLVTAISWGMG